MARAYPVERFATDQTLRVERLNADLDGAAAEMNGHLDRDNINADAIAADKAAFNTWHGIQFVEASAPLALTAAADWQTVLSTTGLVTDDGRLHVEASFSFDAASTARGVGAAIFLDGALVAASPKGRLEVSGANAVIAAPPVGAGPHTVELKVHTQATTTINGRSLFCHQGAR